MDFKQGDKVTVSRNITKIVTVASTGTGCFTGTDGISYHIKEDCWLAGTVLEQSPMWEVINVEKQIKNWPPQENDVWKAGICTVHVIGGKYYTESAYSSDVSPKTEEWVKTKNPELLYRTGQ